MLVGANDVGKSSLLRMLDLVLGASYARLFQAFSPSEFRDQTKPLVMTVTLVEFTEDERAAFPDEIAISSVDGSESLTIELEASISESGGDEVVVRRYYPGKGDRSPSRGQLDSIGWNLLSANRFGSAEDLGGRRSPLRAMLSAVDLGEERASLVAALSDFNGKLAGSASINELIEVLSRHLSEAMPRDFSPTDLVVRTSGDPDADPLEDVDVFLAEPNGTARHLSDQSDGIRQVMNIAFFDLARAKANIVAVDEPELHLHIASQRTIAQLLANAPNQRILATHSPHIVHHFDPDAVAIITPDRTVKQFAGGKVQSLEKLMASWWSPRTLESLTSAHTLVVEGIADRLVVEACAAATQTALVRLGVTVLDIGGADKFRHVNRLLGARGFGLSLVGLVDKKESQPWIQGLGAKASDVNVQRVFVCDQDLEAEYVAGLGARRVAEALVEAKVAREQGLLQAASVAAMDELSDEAVAQFCRDPKRKVEAALAVSPKIGPEDVAKMPAMSGLMNFLGTLLETR